MSSRLELHTNALSGDSVTAFQTRGDAFGSRRRLGSSEDVKTGPSVRSTRAPLQADYVYVAEDSFTINLSADTNVRSVALFAEVLDPRGEPLSGVYVTFRLQGEGSFDELTSVHTQQRRTSRQGVSVTWYEYPIQRPRMALTGTVTASCPYAESVKLRPGTYLLFNWPDAAAIGTPLRSQDEIPPEIGVTESASEAVVIANRPEAPTGAISEAERSWLFAMLSAGTLKHLGREPTVSEFIRLCDGVSLGRKLGASEGSLFSQDAEIYWTGDDWVINRLETREDRVA